MLAQAAACCGAHSVHLRAPLLCLVQTCSALQPLPADPPSAPHPPGHHLLCCAGEGKMFSPGNLRATFDNAAYEKLIAYYVGGCCGEGALQH